MTFDDYMKALKELSEWLENYRRVSLEPRSITRLVSDIKKQAERKTGKLSNQSKIDLIRTVNTNLTHLLGYTSDYPPMYNGLSTDAESTLLMLCYTEPERFRKIIKNGYLPLFEKNDLGRAKRDFRRASQNREVIGSFHQAIKFIAKAIDDSSGKSEVRGAVLDLYITIRDIGSKPPLVAVFEQYRISGLFAHNMTETDLYCHRINNFAKVLHKLEPLDDFIELNRNSKISDVENLMSMCLDGLEELYVDLSYAKILSVV